MSSSPTSDRTASVLADGARLARSAAQLDGRDTELVRQLAERVFQLRMAHKRPDDRPDLRGQTWAYRSAVTEMYEASGVPPEQLEALKTRVQYRVSELVHAHMDAEGIDPQLYGMKTRSRRDGLREDAQRRRAGVDADADDPHALVLAALREASRAMTVATTPECLAAIASLPETEVYTLRRALARVADAEAVVRSAL